MLNHKLLSKKHFYKTIWAVVVFFHLFFSLSCGRRKPPQPPVEQVVQRTVLQGTQRGNIILLSWRLPAQNAADASLLNISRADVYRLTEPLTIPLALTEEEFASNSTLISSVPISEADFRRGELSYTDTLQFAGQNARLRYAVRFVNASGQKAAFSNFLLVEPSARVANNPTELSGLLSEDAVEISWNSPSGNVDGSKPANIVGFNVYRIDGKLGSAELLTPRPVTGNSFADRAFKFDSNYQYYVRTISLGDNGELLESLNSNLFEVTTKDTFAPSAPSALTIAAAPGNLSIFFVSNAEKDVSGYRIYRSSDSSRPLSEWTLLTNELLTTNTFQDTNVESGKTYFYYLTAVDKNGNVSPKSVIVSEKVP